VICDFFSIGEINLVHMVEYYATHFTTEVQKQVVYWNYKF